MVITFFLILEKSVIEYIWIEKRLIIIFFSQYTGMPRIKRCRKRTRFKGYQKVCYDNTQFTFSISRSVVLYNVVCIEASSDLFYILFLSVSHSVQVFFSLTFFRNGLMNWLAGRGHFFFGGGYLLVFFFWRKGAFTKSFFYIQYSQNACCTRCIRPYVVRHSVLCTVTCIHHILTKASFELWSTVSYIVCR